MNTPWLPLSLLAICNASLLELLRMTKIELPDLVASSFDSRGLADAWMPKGEYIMTLGGLAIALSLIIVIPLHAPASRPGSRLVGSDRGQSGTTGRRKDSSQLLFRAGIWLACICTLMMLGLHFQVLKAHTAQPVQLPESVWLVFGGFIVILGCWAILLIRRFGANRRKSVRKRLLVPVTRQAIPMRRKVEVPAQV